MAIWWAIPGFVGLVGVLMLFGGLGRLFKLRLVSGGFRFLFGGLALAGAAVIGLVGLNLQTYARLTHESLAAQIELKQTGPSQFTATVRKANDKGILQAPQDFQLAGDKVRIEGRVWKFKPWANVIGADSFYRFERIQGRWDDPARENATPGTANDAIRDDAGIDVFKLPLGSYTPIQLDTTFGSGVYMPMVDGAIYDVSITQSAFIARGKNEIAVNALNAWANNAPSVQPETPGDLAGPTPAPAPAQPNAPPQSESNPPPPEQKTAPPG